MIRILGTIFAALLGLAFGSFLNVCLSRWPQGESVVRPRSHCRHCNHTLAWWENVPLVSWLVLRGRCRTCRAWIGWRYPLVEAAVGALWAISLWHFSDYDPELPPVAVYCGLIAVFGRMILCWLLVALAVLDLENLWLPNWLTIPGTVVGFLFVLLGTGLQSLLPTPYSAQATLRAIGWAALYDLLGILAAAGLILLIRWLYWFGRRREGIGLGDAKLMALLAAWLGLPGTLLAFGMGIALGTLAAVVLLAVPSARRDSETWAFSKLPLGTFLCVGGIVSSLWGQPIIAAYLRWAGF
ncbi:MAG TPA: prepilin peptidase [Terracidiphilus sp.]|nr:prepilin peptidase [Terracidiphilus sp.]